jgi:hypothetical protein
MVHIKSDQRILVSAAAVITVATTVSPDEMVSTLHVDKSRGRRGTQPRLMHEFQVHEANILNAWLQHNSTAR